MAIASKRYEDRQRANNLQTYVPEEKARGEEEVGCALGLRRREDSSASPATSPLRQKLPTDKVEHSRNVLLSDANVYPALNAVYRGNGKSRDGRPITLRDGMAE